MALKVCDPRPLVESVSAPKFVNLGDKAELSVAASVKYGQIVYYEWDFGADGSWDSAGSSLSSLSVKMGSPVSTVEVLSGSANLPPEIDLLHVSDSVVSIGDTVGFRVDFSDGNGKATVKTFEWDFDGDGDFETSLSSPDSVWQVYDKVGTYAIAVRITDSSGLSASASRQLRVVQGEPVALLEASPASVGIGDKVTFTASALDDNGVAPDGRIVKYEWDFDGDGNYEQITHVDYTSYAFGGTYENHVYTAKIRVTDDDGNRAEAFKDVTVTNRKPTLGNVRVKANPVSIDKLASLWVLSPADPDSNLVDTVTWSFGDGAASIKLGLKDTLKIKRATPQILTVTATVKEAFGQTASSSAQLEISEGTATVSGVDNRLSYIGATVKVSPVVSFSLGQTLQSCRWSLGGGAFGNAHASCDTSLTMPSTPKADYLAVFVAISDVGTELRDTIHIKVRDALYDSRDGRWYPVQYVTDGSGQSAYKIGWCGGPGTSKVDTSSHGDSAGCANGYGRLYRWNDVMGFPLSCNSQVVTACGRSIASPHQGLCPSGWHVPSVQEWTFLMNHAEIQDAVSSNSGAWLKGVVKGLDSWNQVAYNMQDSLGYSLMPAGMLNEDGYRYKRDSQAYYWTDTEYQASYAWYLQLSGTSASVTLDAGQMKQAALSLRCVQN